MLKSFKLIRSNVNIVNKVRVHKGAVLSEKWDLLAAVCIERKPVITPELNELEKEFKELQMQIEYEKSLKSNFEVKHRDDIKRMEAFKKGENVEEDVIKQTNQDLLDAWTDELSKFEPAQRITEADKKNDLKSLNRKLDKNLILVVKQKLGKDNLYLLPQGVREDGETLRQTAERVLKQHCGDGIQARIFGNAPAGFYKYKYPIAVRNENGSTGAKVFIYFGRYLNGNVVDKVDYKWLDKDELGKCFSSKYNYLYAVNQMLLD